MEPEKPSRLIANDAAKYHKHFYQKNLRKNKSPVDSLVVMRKVNRSLVNDLGGSAKPSIHSPTCPTPLRVVTFATGLCRPRVAAYTFRLLTSSYAS